MNLIIKSGYLKLHPNGIMATIVFSDGNESQALVTKRQALEIGEALLGLSITEDEWKIIRQQIHASSLLERNAELETFVSTMEGKLEEVLREIEKVMREQKRQDGEGESWKL